MSTSWFSLAVAALIGLAVGCLGMLIVSLSIDGPVDREKKLQAELRGCEAKLTEVEAGKTRDAEQFAAEQAAANRQITAAIEEADRLKGTLKTELETNTSLRNQISVLQEKLAKPKPETTASTSWKSLGRWQGDGMRTTDSFTIAASQGRIRWTLFPESSSGGAFSVYLYRDNGKTYEHNASSDSSGDGESFFRVSPGSYYLEILSANANWSITVEVPSN